MHNAIVYVETSVISYLANRPSRDLRTAAKQAVTHEWWALLDLAQVRISSLVVQEIARGDAQAAQNRLRWIESLQRLQEHPEQLDLAYRLINEGLVPSTEQEDALHIAQATLCGCRYLVTWNFSHFVGPEPRHQITFALKDWGYSPAILTTPEELLEGIKP
jgi:predicted nucleic acid-binding protein